MGTFLKNTRGWKAFATARRGYVEFLASHPLLLIFATVVYAAATFVAAFFAAVLTIATIQLVRWMFELKDVDYEAFNSIFRFYFAILAVLVWLDYLYITARSFASAEAIHGLTRPILHVVQLIVTTVFIFAVAHYYVALFSDTQAYHGIDPPRPEYPGMDWPLENKLVAVPSFETVVNCIYFSTVTTATVGYGDIYPKSSTARIVTIVQVIFSFGLVVVLLGWVIGHADTFQQRGGTRPTPCPEDDIPIPTSRLGPRVISRRAFVPRA